LNKEQGFNSLKDIESHYSVNFFENIIRDYFTIESGLFYRLNPGQIISPGGKVKGKSFGFVHSDCPE